MTPPLELDRPSLPMRIASALFVLAWIAFACALLVISVTHLFRAYHAGGITAQSLLGSSIFLIIGLLLLRIGRGFAVALLPYRFTIDRDQMICGHHWRGRWIHPTDLTGLQAIVTGPAWSGHRWPWILSVRRTGHEDEDPTFIYRTSTSHRGEWQAFQHASEVGARVAAYLGVPLEHTDWSPAILAEAPPPAPPHPSSRL